MQNFDESANNETAWLLYVYPTHYSRQESESL